MFMLLFLNIKSHNLVMLISICEFIHNYTSFVSYLIRVRLQASIAFTHSDQAFQFQYEKVGKFPKKHPLSSSSFLVIAFFSDGCLEHFNAVIHPQNSTPSSSVLQSCLLNNFVLVSSLKRMVKMPHYL